ncbi:antitermination protein [Candidatus Pelagibacter sp.]|nr:antitermination protein [Candidatus Pelagibacter sp.]
MKNGIKNNINSRVIIIQKLYGNLFNKDEIISFPKHRFKKYIKDVVNGTIERDEVINDELLCIEKDYNLNQLDKIFTIIIKAAIFEFLYKSKTPIKIIIKEYLEASNYFLNPSQVKYLHSIIDKLGKNIRKNYERV